MARAMNGQQHVLHHIVDVIECDAATPRDRLNDRDAVTQQRLVSDAVASLRSRHQGRSAQIGAGIFGVNGHATPGAFAP